MSEVLDPNHTECQTFDLSDLIQGESKESEWNETYKNRNGEALDFSFKVERVDEGQRMGLKVSLSTAYKHKREARFRGVLLRIRSKGKRDDNFLYHKFGEATNWVLMYNEWEHLEFGNLGDYLHNMTSFEVEWWLIEKNDDSIEYTRFYYN